MIRRPTTALVHLRVVRRRLEILIVLGVLLHRVGLSSGLRKVNLLAAGASAGVDDVGGINLGEVVFFNVCRSSKLALRVFPWRS